MARSPDWGLDLPPPLKKPPLVLLHFRRPAPLLQRTLGEYSPKTFRLRLSIVRRRAEFSLSRSRIMLAVPTTDKAGFRSTNAMPVSLCETRADQ